MSQDSPKKEGTDLPDTHAPALLRLDQLLSKRRKDVFAVRELSLSLPTFPASVRKQVYPVLLGVSESDTSFSDDIAVTDADLDNQRIIASDVARTRRNLDFFKDDAVQGIMVKLLTFYCKRRGTAYTQGMNEVLAAFINLFVDELSEKRSALDVLVQRQALIFNCFYAFMSRFLHSILRNDNFRTLKCSLLNFSLLLRFHDPQLWYYLDQFSIDPELYAMSWFLTAFAHGTEIRNVERIWDTLIVHDNCVLLHHIAVAVIMHFRDDLLNAQVTHDADGTKQASRDSVFETLLAIKQKVKGNADLPVLQICKQAIYLEKRTPRTLHSRIESTSFSSFVPDELALVEARKLKHVFVTPKEFLLQLARQSNRLSRGAGNINAVKYFVLDCRSLNEHNHECIATSLNLPPDLLISGENQCNAMIESLKAMMEEGCVFCFIDSDAAIKEARATAIKTSSTNFFGEASKAKEHHNGDNQQNSETTNQSAGLSSDLNGGASLRQGTGRKNLTEAAFASAAVEQWVLFLSQRGISRCAVVDGGFETCRALARVLLKRTNYQEWEIFQKPIEISGQKIEPKYPSKGESSLGVGSQPEFSKIGQVFQRGFNRLKDQFGQLSKNIDEEFHRSQQRNKKKNDKDEHVINNGQDSDVESISNETEAIRLKVKDGNQSIKDKSTVNARGEPDVQEETLPAKSLFSGQLFSHTGAIGSLFKSLGKVSKSFTMNVDNNKETNLDHPTTKRNNDQLPIEGSETTSADTSSKLSKPNVDHGVASVTGSTKTDDFVANSKLKKNPQGQHPSVSLASIMQNKSLQLFKAFIWDRSKMKGPPCFLALDPMRLRCLVSRDQLRGECSVVFDRSLVELKKLTLKKSNPDLLVFHFSRKVNPSGIDDSDKKAESAVQKYRFLVPVRKKDCVEAVLKAFRSIQLQKT